LAKKLYQDDRLAKTLVDDAMTSLTHQTQPRTPQLLPVTPSPHALESPLGFVLRVAQVNGFTNLALFHRFITSNTIVSTTSDLSLYVDWLGKDRGLLELMSYNIKSRKRFMFFGRDVPAWMLDATSAKICPDCIKDSGFIHAFWDIQFVTVCPLHRCALLHSCKACRMRIGWNRSRLDVCRCGVPFERQPGDAPQYTVDLHRFLYKAAFGDTASNATGNPCSLQDHPLNGMSIEMALKTIRFIGLTQEFGNLRRRLALSAQERIRLVDAAAFILSNWPDHINDFMEKAIRLDTNTRFNDFFGFLLQGDPQASKAPFYQEIATFMAVRHARFPRMLSRNSMASEEWIGVQAAAKYLRVSDTTVRRLCTRGVLTHTKSKSGKAKKLFVLKKDLETIIAEESVSASTAAKKLCLKLAELKALELMGEFVKSNAPTAQRPYLMKDIKTFLHRINALLSNLNDQINPSISWRVLAKVMDSDAKVYLLQLIFQRKIGIYSKIGHHWPDIYLDRHACDEWMEDFVAPKQTHCPRALASHLTSISSCHLKKLVEQSFIEGYSNSGRSMVDLKKCESV
jgi:hypothetical protein